MYFAYPTYDTYGTYAPYSSSPPKGHRTAPADPSPVRPRRQRAAPLSPPSPQIACRFRGRRRFVRPAAPGGSGDATAGVRRGVADQVARRRPAPRPAAAHPPVPRLRLHPGAALEPARRCRDVLQLRRPLPADHHRRRDLRRRPQRQAAQGPRKLGHQAGARHLRPARPRRTLRARRHGGADLPGRAAVHRHQLDQHPARRPARRVGPGGRPREPVRRQGQGRPHPARPRRHGARLADRLDHDHDRGRRRAEPARRHGGRLGRRAAGGRRVRRRRDRGIPAAGLSPDPAARRPPAAAAGGGGGARRGGGLRATQASSQRILQRHRRKERLRRLRRPRRPHCLDQLHGPPPALLRRLDGHARRGREAASAGG